MLNVFTNIIPNVNVKHLFRKFKRHMSNDKIVR